MSSANKRHWFNRPRRETERERQLRQLAEQSGQLSNAGKRLAPAYDPNVPQDQRLAYKVLKDANMAPEWVERGKALEHELKKLRSRLDAAVREYDRAYAAAEIAPPGEGPAMRQNARAAFAAARRKLAIKVEQYNRDILTYNLSVPPGIKHRFFFDLEAETEKRLRGS